MTLQQDIEMFRHEVATDTYTTTWREVLGQFRDRELEIDPDYQRLFRWDADRQTQYIESILLNIPSPPLFFAQNKDGTFEVIDGLQRVSTMLKFFARPTEPSRDQSDLDTTNDLTVPLTLSEGPIVKSLQGFSAQTLPETLTRTIRYSRITVILLEKSSSVRARYEVFKRLNKQGATLTDQEIRNCTGRMFGSEFPQMLREVAADAVVSQTMAVSEEEAKQMRVEELVLRMLAFIHSPKPPAHSISEFLDDFMVYASEGKFPIDGVKERIVETFSLIGKAFPGGNAFRNQRGGFSSNLFDVFAAGVYLNLARLSSRDLPELRESLLVSPQFKAVSGPGSNSKKKMVGRTELAKSWFTV